MPKRMEGTPPSQARRNWLRRLWDKMRVFSSRTESVVSWLAVILAILLTLMLLAFSVCHLCAAAGVTAPSFWRWVATTTFYVFGVPTSDAAAYAAAVAVSLNVVFILVTMWFGVLSLWSLYRHRKRLKQESSIRLYPINTAGTDDINVMRREFEGAESVWVFSGDFSWLRDEDVVAPEMAHDRVTFISSKSRGAVVDALGGERFEQLNRVFVFNSDISIKCSFVKRRGGRRFLYRTESPGPSGQQAVCVVYEGNDTKYLLEAIETLCAKYITPDN